MSVPKSQLGFPDGSVIKDPPANSGDPGSIPASGRSLGGGNGKPCWCSCLENPTDRGAWWATVHGGCKELDMTERLYNNNHRHADHALPQINQPQASILVQNTTLFSAYTYLQNFPALSHTAPQTHTAVLRAVSSPLSPWPESEVFVTQSCPTLCDPVDCSPIGSSVHGILQGRILKWVAIPFSRGPS